MIGDVRCVVLSVGAARDQSAQKWAGQLIYAKLVDEKEWTGEL